MTKHALQAISQKHPLLQIRFGAARISSAGGFSSQIPSEPGDLNPQTYVVPADQQEATAEEDWVVPRSSAEWEFPSQRFGSLEADWVGWFNSELDCILMPHVSEPLDAKYDGGALVTRKMASIALESSLFLGGTDADAETLIASLPTAHKPTWSCRGVRTERVLGWIHPAYFGE